MDTSVPLNEWAGLEHHILFPLRAVRAQARLRRLPLVGRAVQYLLGKKLAFFFELAVVFIQSHSNAHKKLNELFGKNGPVTRQLEKEVEEEVGKAKAALEEFVPVFPDIINSVKTEMAARYMLNKCRSMLEAAMESGSLEKREFEDAIREVSAWTTPWLNSTTTPTPRPPPPDPPSWPASPSSASSLPPSATSSSPLPPPSAVTCTSGATPASSPKRPPSLPPPLLPSRAGT
ncbi:cyclic nucleotide-binding protein [Nannochloropsis gaditana]|uniref:Cyclic nucleotide-binding protein n=1 Tax=Nannochloropsis gaditana TaxID=72520 RepID=W7TMP7_9STRA|nr:cyclic nucleotide-binding protein [Nannochloropsis gaditana]